MSELAEMSFWSHLDSLRWTLTRIIIALVVLMIGVFAFVPWIFDHVVMAPSHDSFPLYAVIDRMLALVPGMTGPGDGAPSEVNIINIRLASQFFIHMSLSLWLALLIGFPFVIWEIWKFIAPALYESERGGVRWAFCLGTVMFYLGCAVGYFIVFPMTLRFLYNYQLSDGITNQLSLDSYMDSFLTLIFMMGVIFELPLVAMLLSRLGLLRRSFFSRYRRHAVVALLALAAIITPTSDPFTLMAVFLPVYLLWELSAFLVKADEPTADDDYITQAVEAVNDSTPVKNTDSNGK